MGEKINEVDYGTLSNEIMALYSINADLTIVTDNFYKFCSTYKTATTVALNPALMNLSAYHSAQAIEKGLKLLIEHDSGNEASHTHNISELLVEVELHRSGFVQAHTELAENAHFLTNQNNIRYATKFVHKNVAYKAMHLAKEFYNELTEEFGKPQFEMLQPNTDTNKGKSKRSGKSGHSTKKTVEMEND